MEFPNQSFLVDRPVKEAVVVKLFCGKSLSCGKAFLSYQIFYADFFHQNLTGDSVHAASIEFTIMALFPFI